MKTKFWVAAMTLDAKVKVKMLFYAASNVSADIHMAPNDWPLASITFKRSSYNNRK